MWAALADLESHPEWMKDAESLEFISGATSGVGTVMSVVTRVGPFRTTDLLEVTDWFENNHIRIRHNGVVKGEGTFSIEADLHQTVVTWDETIEFPWWLGGRVTALVAKPILTSIWRGNLKRLTERVSGP